MTCSGVRFLHDRVQEALLVAIHADRRSEIHRRIGDRLLAIIPEDTEKLERVSRLPLTITSVWHSKKETTFSPAGTCSP